MAASGKTRGGIGASHESVIETDAKCIDCAYIAGKGPFTTLDITYKIAIDIASIPRPVKNLFQSFARYEPSLRPVHLRILRMYRISAAFPKCVPNTSLLAIFVEKSRNLGLAPLPTQPCGFCPPLSSGTSVIQKLPFFGS